MNVFQLLSRLLDYPDESLRAAIAAEFGPSPAEDAVRRVDAGGLLSAAERAELAAFIERVCAADPTELKADYVKTFDLTPEHSLHITHHIFGEERTRGPALIDLAEYYRSYGLTGVEGELPDYLPLMLEFAAQLSADEAQVFLGDVAKVLDVLAANLEKSASPYAPLIRIVERQGHLARRAA